MVRRQADPASIPVCNGVLTAVEEFCAFAPFYELWVVPQQVIQIVTKLLVPRKSRWR